MCIDRTVEVLQVLSLALPAYNNILDKRGLKRNIWVTELTSPLTKKRKKRINLPVVKQKEGKKKNIPCQSKISNVNIGFKRNILFLQQPTQHKHILFTNKLTMIVRET